MMIVPSKTAGRAVLGSVFFIGAAILLWSIAVGAYVIFYLSYIPVRGFTLPLYFQFEQSRNLFASVRLPSGRLVSGQPYDVKVHLHLPRTPANTAAGNFMLDLQLFAPPSSVLNKAAALPDVVASERRPAILTYYSPGIENVHNFVSLPWYVLGWRRESEKLQVPIMEGIEFSRGRQNLPTDARVEIVSPHHLQVYNAQISFRTRLKGLRYLMYNYRIISFVVFTSMFWTVELLFTAVAWSALTWVWPGQSPFAPKSDNQSDVSVKEENEIQDAVKKEEPEEKPIYDYPPAVEADDEDEETLGQHIVGTGGLRVSDSGIGTSLESSASRQDSFRRRSKLIAEG